MGQGLKRASAAATATNLTTAQWQFLRRLRQWTGAATPQELGPQTSQEENSARQRCKRLGLVTYDGSYWRLTDAGREVVRGAL